MPGREVRRRAERAIATRPPAPRAELRADGPRATRGDAIKALQRRAGNRAIAGLLRRISVERGVSGAAVQRWPIPTKAALETEVGYTGGRWRKLSWGVFTAALNTYAGAATKDNAATLGLAAATARATFETPAKQRKVGLAKANQIAARLRQIEADCEIAVNLLELRAAVAADAPQTAQSLDAFDLKHAQLRVVVNSGRTPVPGDLTGEVGTIGTWLTTRRKALVRGALEVMLVEAGYEPERARPNYWSNPDVKGALPHVAWKAHIGATSATAVSLLRQAIPVLLGAAVQHKVDSDPEVFAGTNKFITIYPPSNEDDWGVLIPALEKLHAEMAPVPGELPVGDTGMIGMRHGQITPLTPRYLEELGLTTRSTGPVIRIGRMRLTPVEIVAVEHAEVPAVDNSALPGGVLYMGSDGVAYFWNEAKVAPAIIHEGAVRPDPRAQPNPFNQALPKRVKTHH